MPAKSTLGERGSMAILRAMFPRTPLFRVLHVALLLLLLGGCSASKQRLATEQLVISDSVDRSVAKIDFSPLAGRKVFLETKYMIVSRPAGFVGPEYVISSLRQQMMAYDLRLMDKPEDADIIVEARCGVLGNDGHDVSLGIPAGPNWAATAGSAAGYPMPAALPEISLTKRMDQLGATKVAVFAYDKETKEPMWHSGLATSISTAKDFWVLGVGPIQRGSVYGGTRFAGDPLKPIDPVALARRLPDSVVSLGGVAKRDEPHEDDTGLSSAGFLRDIPPQAAPEQTTPMPTPPDDLKWAPLNLGRQ